MMGSVNHPCTVVHGPLAISTTGKWGTHVPDKVYKEPTRLRVRTPAVRRSLPPCFDLPQRNAQERSMHATGISRTDAFRAQGVVLTSAQSSWSGIREDDGAVVIAIRAADIHADLQGCHCLLWAPVIEAT